MIRFIIDIYIFILILDAVISFIPELHKYEWIKPIKKAADFTLSPIRKMLPKDLPFDLSPLVVIILLKVLVALW